MILAKRKDKKYVIDMLENSMKHNPTLVEYSRTIRGKSNIRPILEYAFHYSFVREGIYLSDDRQCVGFFNHSKNKFSLIVLYYQVKLVLFGLKLKKLRAIFSHMKKIRSFKPRDTAYYHFWFLGSTPNSTMIATRDFLLGLLDFAKSQNLPVFAETTIPKNKVVFNRYGMKVYETVENEDFKLTTYLMKA